MAVRIAVIADVHYRNTDLASSTKRRYAIADILLLRAIKRLNRFIKPDITLLLGDLVDQGNEANARQEMEHIKGIVDQLESPAIILPGNHDGNTSAFYDVFPRPADIMDVKDVRFVQFIDPEEPHYNSLRTALDLQRMAAARNGWDGSLVSVQHVPLFPTGQSKCPYHLLNDEEAIRVFRDNGYTLAISGHYHEGDDLFSRGAGDAVIAPALCQAPFAFFEINIDGGKVDVKRHELQMPPELKLIDYHVHTPFAYCQENMNMQMAADLASELGLARMSFSEHSSHLYYCKDAFKKAQFLHDGVGCEDGRDLRMPDYLSQAKQFAPHILTGLEIDCDYSGNQVVMPEDLRQVQVKIGAVHRLAELQKPEQERDAERAADEFLASLEKFTASGIDILAHPFRVFRRGKVEMPTRVIEPLVRMLKENGVAAEINYHTNNPMPEVVKMCVDQGIKLTFGSDSHNLYEVGEFYPHLELLKNCGFTTSDLPEILAKVGED